MMTLTMGDILGRNPTASTPWNITAKMRHWRDSIQDIGGFWQGSGTFWTGKEDPFVSRIDAIGLFMSGLGYHIVRSQAGRSCWEGRISALELTLDGMTIRRSLENLANNIKIIYSRWGANKVINGSAESPLINLTNYYHVVSAGEEMIITQSAEWSSIGTYSFKVTHTGAPGVGWYGGFGLYAGNVTASSKYRVMATCYVPVSDPSGVVSIDIINGGWSIYHRDIIPLGGSGTMQVVCDFTTPGDATGALSVEFTCNNVLDEAGWYWHIDGVTFQEFGSRAELGWLGNSDSIALYGPKEDIKLMDSITDEEAVARQIQLLARHSWPRNFPVDIPEAKEDGLSIEAEGYIFVQAGKSVTFGGVTDATIHLTTLLSAASFISAGYIATNSLPVYVDDVNPIRLWDGLEKVVKAGGAGGIRYVGGVGPGRLFNYRARDTLPRYRRKGGQWFNMDNTMADPQTMQPAIVFLEDMPSGTGIPVGSSSLEDDPRYAYVPKLEYDADTDSIKPIEIKDLDDWQS